MEVNQKLKFRANSGLLSPSLEVESRVPESMGTSKAQAVQSETQKSAPNPSSWPPSLLATPTTVAILVAKSSKQ